MKSTILCLFTIFIIVPLAEARLSWEWVAGGNIAGVVHDGERFVAVGTGGALLTSETGAQWSYRDNGTNWFPQGILYDGDRYIVVGLSGRIHQSTDLEEWTQVESGTNQALLDITHANGLYVIVGRQGTILTSPDGLTWSTRTSGTTEELAGVAGGNGRFAATGVSGVLLSSADGVTWQSHESGTSLALRAIIHDGSGFIVQGTNFQLRSADGLEWENVPSAASGYRTMLYAGGRYVTAGLFGRLSVSSDNENWAIVTPAPTSQTLAALAYGNDVYVAVGAAGAVVALEDGGEWTLRTNEGTEGNFQGLAFGDGAFVGVAASGRIARSVDGSNWPRQTAPSFTNLWGVTHAKGRFVAAGSGGAVWSSPDGVEWEVHPIPVTTQLNDVVHANGRWYVVGDEGAVISSADLEAWTVHATNVTVDFRRAAHGAGVFVALASTQLYTSPDADTWTERDRPGASGLHDILHVNDTFWIAENNQVLLSADGIDWTSRIAGISSPRVITHDGAGTLVVAGFGGGIATSSDGLTWTPVPADQLPTGQTHSLAAFGLGRFVLVSAGLFSASAPPRSVELLEFGLSGSQQIRIRWTAQEQAAYAIYAAAFPHGLERLTDVSITTEAGVAEAVIDHDPATPARFLQVREE